jgi:outer membrane receptor for Fe3+-dicitrate
MTAAAKRSSRSNISSKTKKFSIKKHFHFHAEYEFNERFRLKIAIYESDFLKAWPEQSSTYVAAFLRPRWVGETQKSQTKVPP